MKICRCGYCKGHPDSRDAARARKQLDEAMGLGIFKCTTDGSVELPEKCRFFVDWKSDLHFQILCPNCSKRGFDGLILFGQVGPDYEEASFEDFISWFNDQEVRKIMER